MTAPKPARKFDRSIIEGPIGPAVWMLAWPTMLQNIIGGLQGIVDHVMVGHNVGFTGNAAVGVSWQIFLVVVVFVSSLYSGMGVLVSRFAGQGDHENVNRAVYQAFLASVILAVGILAPIGYFAAPALLRLVNATEVVRAEALPFLRIMFVFSIGMLMFFMMGGALRAAGDAKTPLRLGILLTVLNMGLNIVLIRMYGTKGAAMGTSIAGGVVTMVSIWLLFSGRVVVHWHRGMSLKPDWAMLRELFRFGLPTGFQGIAMNVAGVIMLRFIGSLTESAQSQAAFAVCYTELFSLITWTSQGLLGATAAVAGQNLGAGKPERTRQSTATSARIGLVVAASIGLMFLLIPGQLLGIFGMSDPDVVRIGTRLLGYLSVSGLFIAVALAYTGGLTGTGDTKSPFYISIISQIVVPLGMCTLIQAHRPLAPGDIWLAIVLGHMTRCVLSVLRFRQGRWRSITLRVGSGAAAA